MTRGYAHDPGERNSGSKSDVNRLTDRLRGSRKNNYKATDQFVEITKTAAGMQLNEEEKAEAEAEACLIYVFYLDGKTRPRMFWN